MTRTAAKTFQDLRYAYEPRLMALLEEISKLLERYSAPIVH